MADPSTNDVCPDCDGIGIIPEAFTLEAEVQDCTTCNGTGTHPPSTLGRYLIFGGERYYPTGGWYDFKMSTDDRTSAINQVDLMASRSAGTWPECEWAQAIDTASGDIIHQVGDGFGQPGHSFD